MFAKVAFKNFTPLKSIAPRSFSTTSSRAFKVAVLGAGGGIGQPLSMLLKLNDKVSELALFDIRGAPGVAADIGHINTTSNVVGYAPDDKGLEKALNGADVVIIPAGVPRKPGMTRDDLFATNASIVRDLAFAAGETCPEAKYLVVTNPVNSTVPIFKKALERVGVHQPKHLFGVTTLDSVRASRFTSQVTNGKAELLHIPVVGGHSGATIVPLLSQGGVELTGEKRDALIHRIQFGGDEVVKAKAGAGSATLSMAYAGARMASSVLRALAGESGVEECTFVESPLYKDQGIDFFASRVTLGKDGVDTIHPVGKINDYEESLLKVALGELKKSITKGEQFVA
ncbi:malate dehydrogenase Mdh1 [Schizosaccharomyces pombe]|uniref:Malate dehydrogenase, mitochondrial n=1 Tax=Schizosaccharomyces pombe (strain 972 / ATCC 24843) TaxID=284812 RepID=MDHM_SCHPO|nr:putative malate dehydrogenase [Schizosaccharomyces pombe]Q9Y7R8.1 RecName: Full=Malate dehydrogenase, mitochondrial; Flags: Precursor [Schizosaccharomyces pombe 972h-]CAB41656.1 malate dehydrogenase (predicted) [Schizosaccharomyces pombe]|eukprot:NP_001342887.1 putative malate dehydrogenase [Schizosaccharomyces pombe]